MRKVIVLVVIVFLLSIGSLSAQTIDLIALVDLGQDVVNGNWQLVNGELVVDETPAARISFPYHPPLEYDYTVEFTLSSGSNPWGNIAQMASHGDVPFTWSTNAGTGHYCRLEDINGHSVIGNPTLTPYAFVGGQRYTSTVCVRNDRVICKINEQILVEYETDYSDLSRNGKWEMPNQLNLGLGGYAGGGPTTFHSATVTDITELYEWYINPANGHRYALTLNHSNWADAEAEAIAVGGHLVTINDQAECDWLVDENSNPFGLQYGRDVAGDWQYNLVWIGLSYIGGDKTSPSSWEWQNGEPVVFWNPSPQAFDPKYIVGIHMYMNGSTRGDKGTWAFYDEEDIYPQYYLRGVIEVVTEPTTLPVAVDIKPGSCPNPLNTKSHGVLPIAILGSDIFDANTIVPTSVRLAGVEPIRNSLEDVSSPLTDPNECECSDIGPDGFMDLTLKFKTQDIVEALGEVNTGDILTLQLTGVLNDETPIEGSDCIVIVGRHKHINKADINKDGLVNTVDIAIVAENWLQSSIVEE